MADKKTQVVALTSFHAQGDDGEDYLIREGQQLSSEHPVVKVKGREHLFAEAEA